MEGREGGGLLEKSSQHLVKSIAPNVKSLEDVTLASTKNKSIQEVRASSSMGKSVPTHEVEKALDTIDNLIETNVFYLFNLVMRSPPCDKVEVPCRAIIPSPSKL